MTALVIAAALAACVCIGATVGFLIVAGIAILANLR